MPARRGIGRGRGTFTPRRCRRLQRRVSCVLPVPALPRTTSGKLQRFRLADEFASGVHDGAREAFLAQGA